MRVLTVGVTGGSGCGKSSLVAFFCRQGAVSLDADRIYHALTDTPSVCVSELTAFFGDSILLAGGGLDRRALSEIVFCGPPAQEMRLARLNEITHRHVRNEFEKKIQTNRIQGTELLLLDVPLLFESGMDAYCDVTVAVLAGEDNRIKRLCVRDGLTEAQAKARIAAQPPAAFYRARADHIIENDGDQMTFFLAAERLYKIIVGSKKKTDEI